MLQLDGGYLVKTTKFSKPTYVGDPINAVKIFNDKTVDELVITDIGATRGSAIDFRLLADIASEAFMPLGYGGGLRTVEDAVQILGLGYEKVIVNSAAGSGPGLISRLADAVGSQSVVVSVDAKRTLRHRHVAYVDGGRRSTGFTVAEWAQRAVAAGAGEVLVHSIDRDGTGSGFDEELIRDVAEAVDVPVIALGGANSMADFAQALAVGASAVAAGNFFVFQGKYRAVLLSYPSASQLQELCGNP